MMLSLNCRHVTPSVWFLSVTSRSHVSRFQTLRVRSSDALTTRQLSAWRHLQREHYIHGLVQHSSISSVLAMEKLQSCTKSSTSRLQYLQCISNGDTAADLPTPDPAQTIRFMIWNHTISLQTIQFSDQTIQFYSKPYNCLSNHL